MFCKWTRTVILPLFCLFLCAVLLLVGSAWIFNAAIKDKTADRIVTAEQLLASNRTFDCISCFSNRHR